MASWYSNILTKTTSQISSLKSTLLSAEADGDTEDDTHVCRVLRNYYVDKGRPRPGWLPPDPKAANQAPQPMYAQPQVGSRYGGLNQAGGGAGGGGGNVPGAGAGGGALSSLWDNGPAQGGGGGQPMQPQSLRAGRGGGGGAGNMNSNTGGGGGGAGMLQPGGGGGDMSRPGTGSRAGSYNSMNGSAASASGAGGSSAQDRLKQRLYGSRSNSPASQQQHQQAHNTQVPGHYAQGGGGSYGREPQQRQGLPSGPRGYR